MHSKYQESCNVLNIKDFEEITEKFLIKQYRKQSLIYHPDKNKAFDASQKFQEINDSYVYLGKYLGYMEDDDYNDEDIEFEKPNYFSILKSKLVNYYMTNDVISKIQDILLNGFMSNEENISRVVNIYEILCENKNDLNLSDAFLISLSNSIIDSINKYR